MYSSVQTADWIEVRAVCDQRLVEKLVMEVDNVIGFDKHWDLLFFDTYSGFDSPLRSR